MRASHTSSPFRSAPRSVAEAPAVIWIFLLVTSAIGCRSRLYDVAGAEPPDLAVTDALRDLAVIDASLPPFDPCSRVYVIDANTSVLSEFEPLSLSFRDIGRAVCPVKPRSGGPTTMAVDHDGVAWLTTQEDEFFKADLRDARCSRAGFDLLGTLLNLVGQRDPYVGSTFGVAAPNDRAERLYLGLKSVGKLARFDSEMRQLTIVGTVDSRFLGELTSTADGELWTYGPQIGGGAVLSRVNQATAVIERLIDVPNIPSPPAFAVAFWGGSFWIFHAGIQGPTDLGVAGTSIYRVDRQTGDLVSTTFVPGRFIIGAGVSTCAPIGLDRP